jgi:hypothetical protein
VRVPITSEIAGTAAEQPFFQLEDLYKPMKFVIVANSFDDRIGGVIVLHLLCQRLTEAGETALLWSSPPRLQFWLNPRRYLGWLRYYLRRRHRLYSHGPFATRQAERADLAGAVIVYPETIAGNPAGGSNVVRWLLHKPGFHTGQIDYGSDDLVFFYHDSFYEPALGDYKDNRLVVTWWNDEYRQSNFGERSGSCYLLKKGKGRDIAHSLQGSTLIDSLSHAEKAEVFNRAKYFYTYDDRTLYARYAALCGCIPIVVPQPGVTRDQWVSDEEERYGLAYGEDEIEWAVATRPLLLQRIKAEQAIEAAMLRSFIDKCYAKFS